MKILVTIFFCLSFISCTTTENKKGETSGLTLTPSSFQKLQHWKNVSKTESFNAFGKSCSQVEKRAYKTKIVNSPLFGTASDWKNICQKQKNYSSSNADAFFENHFSPVKVVSKSSKFTGYYEPILYGNYIRTGPYQYPLYAPPKNMSMPYPKRSEIVKGALIGKASPIIWVTSEIDSFFLHIQGSGRIVLPNGQKIRAAYAGQNGHKYFAIGKHLIKEGHIEKSKMSAEAIKEWLRANPSDAQNIMNKNPSYVFFKLDARQSKDYAKGAAGVPLTPEYSLAVDRKIYPYGLPMWIETHVKVPNAHKLGSGMAFHRLMIAQDTGGAIKGSVRGDVFFGMGKHAEFMASHLSSPGHKYVLLPKNAVANAR